MARLRSLRTLPAAVRRRAGAAATDGFFYGSAVLGRLHPQARPERHDVQVTYDVPYLRSGRRAHLLDVYRPARVAAPLPVVLYLHGGGFRILSKDTHWMMGLAFARRGYLTFVASYRLAPRDPYPAAHADAAAAYTWVHRNAHHYGGDPAHLVVAGESAGANLALSLALAACARRPEPFAREVFQAGPPRAVVAACGLFQTTDPERFTRGARPVSTYVRDRLVEVRDAYLGPSARPGDAPLADPLLLLEGPPFLERPLPPVFAPVGTRDPLEDDTRRLARAVRSVGGSCRDAYYPGQIHAFHAFMLHRAARTCWQDTFDFLADAGVAPRRSPPPPPGLWGLRRAPSRRRHRGPRTPRSPGGRPGGLL